MNALDQRLHDLSQTLQLRTLHVGTILIASIHNHQIVLEHVRRELITPETFYLHICLEIHQVRSNTGRGSSDLYNRICQYRELLGPEMDKLPIDEIIALRHEQRSLMTNQVA